MKRLNGRRMILWILAVILCVTACGPAFASTGDRTLYLNNSEGATYLRGVADLGDSFCVIMQESMNTKIQRYTDPAGEPETFMLEFEEPEYNFFPTEMTEQGPETPEAGQADAGKAEEKEEEEEEEEEEGFLFFGSREEEDDGKEEQQEEQIRSYGSDYTWFGWNGELYALEPQMVYGEESTQVKEIAVKHAKLEDGKVVVEDTELPALSPEGLTDGDSQYEYFMGAQRIFTAGDRLVILPYNYGNGQPKLTLFNLNDGSAEHAELRKENAGIIPGPDGSVLVRYMDYTETGMSCTFRQMNLDTQEEGKEEFAKIGNIKGYDLGSCYDQGSNTLYYVDSGELWAKSLAEPEKPAEAVNDCPEGENILLLKDGFVLILGYKIVMVKNTDPSQRQGITLRVFSTGYSNAVNDAVLGMNSERGDVSVILEQTWRSNDDILQAMINHDAQNDVYVLSYSSPEFKALRDRGFLMDLSADKEFADAADNLYPYVQQAVKRDGKFIAVPVGINMQSLGLTKRVSEELKITQEELPKTWDQLLDWIPTLPKRLEGTEYTLVDNYMSASSLRMQIIQSILTQYQVWMDSKGEMYDFNTPMLKDLLKRVAELKGETLGIKEEINYEELDDGGTYHEPLLTQMYIGGMDGNDYYVKLPLGFDEESAMLPVTIDVAFMNPYTEHPEEAKEYLKMLLKKMDNSTQYIFFSNKTEPVPSPYAEENSKFHNEYVEALKKQLEKAEGAEKAELEESLREEEKNWEENQESVLWSISSRMIEDFRKTQDLYKVQEYDMFTELFGSSEDKDVSKLLNGLFGYRGENDEEISIDEALSLLDKKVQMKRREGN